MLTETTFTPWASLGGGILIGISAVMVMGLFGKIAGIAGITQGALALPGAARDRDWRIAFRWRSWPWAGRSCRRCPRTWG